MPNFTPQLKLPDAGDPYYNTKKTGGYNPCILGNNDKGQRVKGLNVLPNCVGYCVSRFNELGQYGSCKYLGNTNACNFISLARKQGLQISKDPTLGGVMVWSGGAKNLGHVASVEVKVGTDIVITSESEWYGLPFRLYTRKRGSGHWRDGCNWMGNTYKYEGCIVNPAVPEEDPVTYEQFCDYMKRWLSTEGERVFNTYLRAYLEVQAKKPADPWAVPAIEYCNERGYMVGDTTGNFRPQSFVKREELAAVVKSITE